MANSFTPGPWVFGWGRGLTGPTTPNLNGPTVAGRKLPFAVVSLGMDTIAIMPMQECKTDSYQKNAQLIAAAPELLDAIVTALPYVETAQDDPAYKPGAVAKVVKQMRAVIAKASGEKE